MYRASDFIQRVQNFGFRYKLGSWHIVPHALSRLLYKDSKDKDLEGQLDALWAYTHVITAFVEISTEFKDGAIHVHSIVSEAHLFSEVLSYNISVCRLIFEEERYYRV